MLNSLEFVKQAFEDNCITIDGRDYEFAKTNHLQRKQVFAYLSSINGLLEKGNMSFIDTPEFVKIEKLLGDIITFEGLQLSKAKEHWEKFPQDYLMLIPLAMMVVSYPFLRGNLGGLQYQASQVTQAQ